MILKYTLSALELMSEMPYWRKGAGVEPPLWSSAAMNPGFSDICTFISLLAMAVILAGSNSELTRSPVTIRRGVKEELPFPGLALHTRLGRRQRGLDHRIGADHVAVRLEPEAKTLRHRDPTAVRS